MKRKVVNEKVIRAMAIGISAMLATATPMTAMAAEGEGDPEGGNSNEAEQTTNSEAGVCDAAQKAADAAQESAGTVKTDVETNVSAGEVKDSEGKDLAQEVINAAEKVENKTIEDGTPLADAETDITNTKIQLDTAKANDGLSDSALGKATDAATNAGTIAEDLNKAMDDANAKVDEQLDDIQNATTIAGANAAYDKLASTAEQAQKDFDAKLADYDKAKAAYDEAAAKVKEYEDAYNAAVAAADSNAAAALAELEKAQENAAALEAAVSAAQKAVDASAANAIVKAEKLTQTDGTLNWRNEDTLFAAIMTNYYLPEKLGIKGATVTRVQGKDNNEYNYFEVKYVENGENKVKYFNYKMDGNSKDDIVIFEKRDVEVNGGAFDQYVDDDGNVVDTAKGKEDGTVVEVGDDYVIKNDVTDSDTLVSNSKITGTSITDVTVDKNTEKESWQYDAETGELVKTITADVTTITYTGATFKSNESYATDAERDAAAEKKKAELEKRTGKDATITEIAGTPTYTYTASGTYIPTFTKTVDVNKEYESGYLWYEADSKKEAQDKAYDWAKDQIKDDLGDYYLIGNIESDLSVSMTEEETEEYKIFGKTHTRVTDDSDYLVTGKVSATYAKVTKKTVSQSTFGSLWNDIKALFGSGQSTNEQLKAAAKEAVEADGGIFLSANWDDLNFNKATIRYVAGVKVTTGEEQTEQEAKNAVQGTALEQAKANGATGVYNVKTTGTNDIAHTTYSYTVGYLQKSSENTENKAVATETYGNAVGLTGQIIQNKNYKDGNILLTQKDENYRTFVDDAKAITGKYDRLLTEAKAANDAVLAAQEQVKTLQEEIEALKGKSNNFAALTELTAKLDIAKANRDAAEVTLNTILEKLENAGVTRDQVIERLTPPAPTGGDGGETGGETGGTPLGTTTVTVIPVTTAAVQGTGVTATAATTTVGGGAVAQIGAGDGGIVNIDDEETALAASVDDVDDTANVVEIGDEETPLAASVDNETMSWWWLLLIALLGATGYEMYRKHQQKKEALAETDDVQ